MRNYVCIYMYIYLFVCLQVSLQILRLFFLCVLAKSGIIWITSIPPGLDAPI